MSWCGLVSCGYHNQTKSDGGPITSRDSLSLKPPDPPSAETGTSSFVNSEDPNCINSLNDRSLQSNRI
jgi:hypothetical protein